MATRTSPPFDSVRSTFGGLYSRLRALPWPALLVWGALVAGAALRLRHYLANRSLWLDEALLANQIIGRPLGALAEPLGSNQAAPVGFLAAVWASMAAFGSGEHALRLAALIAGLAALPIFVIVARRYLSQGAVPLAAIVFALAAPLLYYAAELKPYGWDVLAALLVWLLAAALLERSAPLPLALAAAGGAALAWCSYSASLCLAGCGAVLLAEAAFRRAPGLLGRRLLVVLAWAASIAAVYAVSARHLAANNFLADYWSDAFAPMPPRSLGDLRWYLEQPLAVFGPDVAGVALPGLGVLLGLAGGASLAAERRWHLALLIAPLAVALAASALRRYPFEGRLLLFYAPAAIMLVAEGLAWLHRLARPQAAWLAPATGLLLLCGVLVEARGLIVAPAREELRPVLQQVFAGARPGDAVYIYYGAAEATRYYAPRLAPAPALTYGSFVRGDLGALEAELRELPRGRVWLVFSHVYAGGGVDEEQFSCYVLDTIGEEIERVRRPDATAYLYQLPDPVR